MTWNWESMVEHMEDMVKMMSMHSGMGMMESADHSSMDKKETRQAPTK